MEFAFLYTAYFRPLLLGVFDFCKGLRRSASFFYKVGPARLRYFFVCLLGSSLIAMITIPGSAIGLNASARLLLGIASVFDVVTPGVSEVVAGWVEIVQLCTNSAISFFAGIGPLMVISKVFNCVWYQDISNLAIEHAKKTQKSHLKIPASAENAVVQIADIAYSTIASFVFMAQTAVVSMVPMIGFFLAIPLNALLLCYFGFEYSLFTAGVPLRFRMRLIERYWTYFVGFGLLASLISAYSSSVLVSSTLAALLFPVFITSATLTPIPTKTEAGSPRSIPIFTVPRKVTDFALVGLKPTCVAVYLYCAVCIAWLRDAVVRFRYVLIGGGSAAVLGLYICFLA